MMKRQLLLLSMIASSGISAGIEWVDDREPTFEDNLYISNNETLFENEDINLQEIGLEYAEEENYLAESDFILEETPLEHFLEKEEETPGGVFELAIELSDFFGDPSENSFAELDFDLEETPKTPEKKVEKAKDEIDFITQHPKKMNADEQEIALADIPIEKTELVQIAEVGPFSQFTINGKSTKSAVISDSEEVKIPHREIIYFSPNDTTQFGFYLSSTKVTNQEYEAFVKATHHRPPPHWLGGRIPAGLENDPVVNVTYKDAFLYSIWAGKRLPKETELIIAAKSGKDICDINPKIAEWTSTPSFGKSGTLRGASNLTINSELSKITFHKVFMGDHEVESVILDSNAYNNNTGFRTAVNASSHSNSL